MTYSRLASITPSTSPETSSRTIPNRVILTESALSTHNRRMNISSTTARASLDVLRDINNNDNDTTSESSDSSVEPPPEFTYNRPQRDNNHTDTSYISMTNNNTIRTTASRHSSTPPPRSPASYPSLSRSSSMNTPEQTSTTKTSKVKRSFMFSGKPVRPQRISLNSSNSNSTGGGIILDNESLGASPSSSTLGSLNNDLSTLFNNSSNINNNTNSNHTNNNNTMTTSSTSILTPSSMPVTSAIKRRSEEHPFIVNNNKILKQEHRHYPNSPPPPPPRTPQPSTSVSSPTPSPTPPSITESPWDTITICGKLYYQVHLIKTGGSSRVYKVLCKETGSIFAMKDIQMGRIDASKFDSYVEEVTLLQQLQGNGCVIRLHDFEMDKRTLKLRMLFEYGDTDLASYIHKNKLDVYDIRHFWRKMVEATRLLHARKIVHSDLKPGNFVIVRGKVKIIDFGIAKAISDGTVNIKRQTINGTPNYIAPEALSDLFECNQHRFMREEDEDEDDEFKRELYKVGPPADIWALGIILYQMVYGNTPFHNHPNKDNAIRNEPVNFPPKSRNGEHIPPELENAMEWCLKKEAKDRPTAEQLLRHQFLRS